MEEIKCRLCLQSPAIENSHVIPAFVFRAVKSDSPTGFFRNPNNPNRRIQDGDKLQLLCNDCEQRFGKAEKEFAKRIFLPFHKFDQDEFSYGPWLHYFMTSLAWRTLILDLPGLETDQLNPRTAVAELASVVEAIRLYLLGTGTLAGCPLNQVVVWTKGDSASTPLLTVGPNVMIRRSVFGYSLLNRTHGYSVVLHNLAGIMCFLIIKDCPQDTWSGTAVDPSGGEIKQPQRVSSWAMGDLLNCIMDSAGKQPAISVEEQQKVHEAMRKNPSAPGLRHQQFDRQVRRHDEE